MDTTVFLFLIAYALKTNRDNKDNSKPYRPIVFVKTGKPFIIPSWIPTKTTSEIAIVTKKLTLLKCPKVKYIIRPIKGIVNKLSRCRPVASPMI